MSSNSFCIMPWVGLHVDSKGNLFPCCRTNKTVFLKDDTNQQYNLHRHSLDSYLNSSDLFELKKQLLNGEKPNICSYCWSDERIGKRSYREDNNSTFHVNDEYISTLKISDASTVKSVDLQVGNICNQKCRMCEPSASSGLARAQKDINHYSEEDIEFYTKNDVFKWTENENFWNSLKEKSHELVMLKMWGGEAFLNKKAIEYIDYLVDNNYSKNIFLFVNTNGHAIKENLLNKFNKFGNMSLVVSIDGYGKVNEYIRYPSNWSKTVKEIDSFVEWSINQNNPRVKMEFTIVYQLLNILNMPILIKFLINNCARLDYIPKIHLNFLAEPFYMSAQVAPLEVKQKAIKDLEELIQDPLLKNLEYLQNTLTAAINYIKEKDLSFHFDRFLEVNKIYDNLWDQQLEVYVSDICENI